MKRLLLLTAVLGLAPFVSGAYAKPTCGTASGSDAANPGDAALFTMFDGSCSSDNQAADSDDLKAFLDKGGKSLISGPVIDLSLFKNTSLPGDQNVQFNALGATDAVGFTDGNGFANIKSTTDLMQDWTIDPLFGTILDGKGTLFDGFDGVLFRGQFADRPGFTYDGKGKDTASLTFLINLSDGSQVGETFTGLKLNADDGVFGFDEIGTLPKGLFVDSIQAYTDSNHSWDQVKQLEFSIPGATATVPEASTWAMMTAGFSLLGLVAFWRRKQSYAI